MKVLEKVTNAFEKILIFLACLYLAYIVFACSVQVFSRYVLNSSFSWTEETARYAFACMGMLGAPVALRRGMHVSVDILESKLYGRWKKVHEVIVLFCMLIVSIILMLYGWNLFVGMKGIYSSAVRLPMAAIYYSVPLCGFSSCWMIIVGLLEIITNTRKETT